METSQLRKQMPVSALFDPKIVVPAIGSAFVKLDPRTLIKNPVMFVLEIVTILTTIILVRDLITGGGHIGFEFQIIVWLWFTVLFANFAEAVAEGRGKAQADTLRRQRTETQAKLITSAGDQQSYRLVPSTNLKVNDLVLVEAGDTIPSDGEIVARHGFGQRSGDYRRVGAGHSRIRWRPLRRHRRHAGPLRLDPCAHQCRAWFDLSRPHDPSGRGRRAAKDAERNRAQHPADRPHHHFRIRDRDNSELRPLRWRQHFRGRPGCPVRDAHSDHDRRSVVGDRHRRHGPSGPL